MLRCNRWRVSAHQRSRIASSRVRAPQYWPNGNPETDLQTAVEIGSQRSQDSREFPAVGMEVAVLGMTQQKINSWLKLIPGVGSDSAAPKKDSQNPGLARIMIALLWILVASGFLFLACCAVFFFVSLSDQTNTATALSALFLATLVVWPTVGCAALLGICASIHRGWKASHSAFGQDLSSRVLAAGVVGVLFSKTLYVLFNVMINAGAELLWRIPAHVADEWKSGQLNALCRSTEISLFVGNCIQPLMAEFLKTTDVRLSPVIASVAVLDVGYVLLAVALWAFIGQLLSGEPKEGARSTPRWQQAITLLPSNRPATWANIWLFALITFGGMLCASAIIAIPVISEATPLSDKEISDAERDVDALLSDTEVAKRIPTESPLKGRFEDLTLPSNAVQVSQDAAGQAPQQDKDKAAAERSESAGTKPAAVPAADSRNVPVQVSDMAKRIEKDADTLWGEVSGAARRQVENTKTTARNLIAHQNLMLTNVRSKTGYIVDIRSWVESSGVSIFQRLDSCRGFIRESGDRFHDDASVLLTRVRAGSIVAPDAKRGLDDLSQLSTEIGASGSVFREYCFSGTFTRLPEAATMPSLGAFSFAEWLIKLGSIPLTLVAGMLGFGLVGAAISSVVRESSARKTGDPLVQNLGAVVIRGTSATVVVYLATKGGLAIVSGTAAPEPNAYVLLLTCFVASVFGDDVWVNARNWLAQRTRKPSGEAGEGKGAGESAAEK